MKNSKRPGLQAMPRNDHSRLERDIFPWMGKRPISEIKPPEVLAVLRVLNPVGLLKRPAV